MDKNLVKVQRESWKLRLRFFCYNFFIWNKEKSAIDFIFQKLRQRFQKLKNGIEVFLNIYAYITWWSYKYYYVFHNNTCIYVVISREFGNHCENTIIRTFNLNRAMVKPFK